MVTTIAQGYMLTYGAIAGANNMTALRRIELQEGTSTKVVKMIDLKPGDVFKIYEPDTNEQVGGAWKVVTAPTVDNEGIAGVIVDPVVEDINDAYVS